MIDGSAGRWPALSFRGPLNRFIVAPRCMAGANARERIAGFARHLLVLGADLFQARFVQFFQIQQFVVASAVARISSSSLICIAAVSAFCVCWIRNTIRKVMMVVPVLITSCQVSLKPNTGPLMPQITTIATAARKVHGEPVAAAAFLAIVLNRFVLSSSSSHSGDEDDRQWPVQAPCSGGQARMRCSRGACRLRTGLLW